MWTIPDDGEGDSTFQSLLWQEYLDVLVAGMQGIDCVLSGLRHHGRCRHDASGCQGRGAVQRRDVRGGGSRCDDRHR